MELGKPIRTKYVFEETHLLFYEFPDGSLVIEGLRFSPMEPTTYLTDRIRFTSGAIETLTDFLNEYRQKKANASKSH